MDWRTLLEALPASDVDLPSVDLPADIRTHSEQLGESFEARWAMSSAGGQLFSAYAQLDRLKLKENSESDSAWSYKSIARANVSIGLSESSAFDVSEVFSRVALGLADSRGDEFFVAGTSLKLAKENSCISQIVFAHDYGDATAIELSAESNGCPQTASLGTINQWEFEGIPAVGRYEGEALEGFLWLTHRWGRPPTAQSAVVLDQLRLVVLDSEGGYQWMNISRSKRTSGRGPKTVLATVTNAQGTKRNTTVEWEDVGQVSSQSSGLVYPQTIKIRDVSMSLEIELSPIVELSEIRDTLQTRMSGAFQLSGSHTGFAYVDFQPVR